MQSRSMLNRSKQSANGCHLRVSIYAYASHHIMSGGAYFHWLICNVNIGQLFKLVVHAWQFLLNMFRSIGHFVFYPGDVEIHAIMRTTFSLFDLANNASRHMIPGEQFRWPSGIAVSLCVSPTLFFIVRSLISI